VSFRKLPTAGSARQSIRVGIVSSPEDYRWCGYAEAVAGGRRGQKAEVVEEVVEQGGGMPLRQALRHRVRYFCDGAVLGAAAFVNGAFEREQVMRQRFGEKRTSGARRMRGADRGELRVLRDLQKDVMGT
jgi:hypothetical protein